MIETNRRGALGLAATLPFAGALATSAGRAMAATATPEAADKPAWNLTDLYPTPEAWEAARQKVLAALPRLAAYKGTLGQSADSMAKALDDISAVSKEADRVQVYAGLLGDADLRVAQNQERNSLANDMGSALGSAVSWLSPEVLALSKDKVESFIAANETLRRRFAFSLRDTLRTADHTLDASGEKLLALSGPPLNGPSDIYGQLSSSDIPWPTITLSDGKSVRLDSQGYALNRDAPNRDDRKKVFDAFWGEFNAFKNSMGTTLAAKIRGDVFRTQARGYKTSLARAVDGNGIPESVYRTLVSETDAGLPQLHRYFQLRRRMLKLPDIHYYDIYPPLVSLDRTFTLPEMRTTTLAAVAPLGKDYVRRLSAGTAARWMDPRPRRGKSSGAYMNGSAYDVHPYLLLNLGDKYEDMSTFAHEWGHAMHTELTRANQPYDLSNYPTFTAEIASTCNELLLNQYMLGKARTNQEKLFYLGQRLESLRGTYFRQTMFAEFELKIHEMAEAGEGLSGDAFSKAYLDLLKRYHGPQFVIDEPYAIEWAYIPHFYRFFYVYQYATSVTAGTWFAKSILSGGVAERERYLDVLRAGGSDYPTAILQKAGLDMTSPEPYRALIKGFGETIDQIEALLT
jgi:oligoendopeptidase F